MKIALLTDGIWPLTIGGMQKHSYYLAKYLARNKIHVEIYYCIPDKVKAEIPLVDVFSKPELDYLHFIKVGLPSKKYFPGHYIYESYLYSKAVYQKFNPDVDLIYIQGFSGWHLLENNKKQNLKAPAILNFHGLEMFQVSTGFKSKIINAFFRAFVSKNLRMANYVQSLGGKLTNILLSVGIDKNSIIEQGIGIDESWINPEKEYSEDLSVRKFVFVGRYERRKGLEELFDVLEILHKEGRNAFQFDFIGPIPEDKRWEGQGIHYHGQIRGSEAIKKILSDAHILVCPSYSEGMPTVILEAMASGCAIIASDVGAVREQVNDKNGWLIEAANKVMLREAMIKAMELPDFSLREKQHNSIQIIKDKFLWTRIIEKMIKKFNEITSQTISS